LAASLSSATSGGRATSGSGITLARKRAFTAWQEGVARALRGGGRNEYVAPGSKPFT